MKLTTLPTLLALATSCAANAPDIKPTDVDLNAAQTRTELLAQLGAKHEGYQDNGDFVYCTSIDDTDCGQQSTKKYPNYHSDNNKKNCLREETLLATTVITQAGLDACRYVLDPKNEGKCYNEADTSVSIDHFGEKVVFYWATLCGNGPLEHVEKKCYADFPIRDTAVNDTGACVHLGQPSIAHL